MVLSQQDCEAEGSLTWEVPGLGGSGPDKAGTCQYCQMGRSGERGGKVYARNRRLRPQRHTGSNLADLGWMRRAPDADHLPVVGAGNSPRLSGWVKGGCGEVLRGSRGEVAGAKLGASSAE